MLQKGGERRDEEVEEEAEQKHTQKTYLRKENGANSVTV